MAKYQPVNSSPALSSTAALLAAPIPCLEPASPSPYGRLATARLIAAASVSGSPMSKACLSSMIRERKVDVAAESPAGVPDPNKYDPANRDFYHYPRFILPLRTC